MEQKLETKINSSLLYIKEDGNQEFIHDTIKEYYLAKYFAEKINNDEMSIDTFWKEYASYEEDAELWNLPKDREWRGVLPAYKTVIPLIMSMIPLNPFKELMNLISKGHYSIKKEMELNKKIIYNPYETDSKYILELTMNNPTCIINQEGLEDIFKEIYDSYHYHLRLELMKKARAKELIIEDIEPHKSENWKKEETLQLWGDIGYNYIGQNLIDELTDQKKSSEEKNTLINKLKKLEYKKAGSIIFKILTETDDDKIQESAINALKKIKYKEAGEYILYIFKNIRGDEKTRKYRPYIIDPCIEYLAEMGYDEIGPELLQKIKIRVEYGLYKKIDYGEYTLPGDNYHAEFDAMAKLNYKEGILEIIKMANDESIDFYVRFSLNNIIEKHIFRTEKIVDEIIKEKENNGITEKDIFLIQCIKQKKPISPKKEILLIQESDKINKKEDSETKKLDLPKKQWNILTQDEKMNIKLYISSSYTKIEEMTCQILKPTIKEQIRTSLNKGHTYNLSELHEKIKPKGYNPAVKKLSNE